MDCKRKGWTARGKDGQQKDISVKESPKGPPDLSRVAQPTAARGGILDKFPPPQSQLKPLERAGGPASQGGQASWILGRCVCDERERGCREGSREPRVGFPF
jgi:hypothetical protein